MESSPSQSYFRKTVTLHDWWLIKPETDDDDDDTKALGVAGINRTSQQNSPAAVRKFTSAPICKVFDIFELETVDGVCIILQGFINKVRTLQSGFSSEVFNHFLIGFPVYWERFATSCSKKKSTAIHVAEDVNDELLKANMKEACCRNKKKNKLKEETTHAAQKTDSKKEIMTRSKSKVTRQHAETTPKRRRSLITASKSTPRANKHDVTTVSASNGSATKIVSLEEFGGKKSRYGRVLLSSLEFWSNQKVVYDKDNQVCGVEEPIRRNHD